MKTLQRLCVAIALSFVLALSVYAGEMSTGAGVAPPPAPTSSTTQGNASGQIPTGPGVTTEDGSFSEVVWGVVEGVLALL